MKDGVSQGHMLKVWGESEANRRNPDLLSTAFRGCCSHCVLETQGRRAEGKLNSSEAEAANYVLLTLGGPRASPQLWPLLNVIAGELLLGPACSRVAKGIQAQNLPGDNYVPHRETGLSKRLVRYLGGGGALQILKLC